MSFRRSIEQKLNLSWSLYKKNTQKCSNAMSMSASGIGFVEDTKKKNDDMLCPAGKVIFVLFLAAFAEHNVFAASPQNSTRSPQVG